MEFELNAESPVYQLGQYNQTALMKQSTSQSIVKQLTKAVRDSSEPQMSEGYIGENFNYHVKGAGSSGQVGT